MVMNTLLKMQIVCFVMQCRKLPTLTSHSTSSREKGEREAKTAINHFSSVAYGVGFLVGIVRCCAEMAREKYLSEFESILKVIHKNIVYL